MLIVNPATKCDLPPQLNELEKLHQKYKGLVILGFPCNQFQNHVRSYEALGMETPAFSHNFSTRVFPDRISEFDNASNFSVVKVSQNGAIRWRSYYWVYLIAALKGKCVGFEDVGNGIWKVYYRNVFLGYFNEYKLRSKESSTRVETNLV